MALIESAVAATLAAEPIEARIREAAEGRPARARRARSRAAAALAGEPHHGRRADRGAAREAARDQVIRVDDFAQDLGASEMRRPAVTPAAAGAVAHKAAA